jgi:voltage-gated potassium channel Kch
MLRELAISLLIVAVCLVIHSSGLILLADWLLSRRSAVEQRPSHTQYSLLLIAAFTVILLLHVFQTGIWAAFYRWRELFPDYETSLYFSLTSYTTIGYGDVTLPQRWRLLGAVEGISGVLLCGLSTAFLFALVNAMFQLRLNSRTQRASGGTP